MKTQIKSILILCLICLPKNLLSNELTISGTVRDANTGKPVPYIKVECINETDTTSAESGLDGRYNIDMQSPTNVHQTINEYVPANFHLEQNYPNPFNPSTTIQFSVPRAVNVQLTIYNILGQKVKTLVDRVCQSGNYSVSWDAMDQAGLGVSTGLYFYRLQAEDYVNVKKMILLDGAVGSWHGGKSSAAQSHNKTQQLPKTSSDFVTIRASSARIQPFEQSQVLLTEPETFFDINVTLLDVSGFDKERVVVTKPNPNSDVYVCGLPMAVVDSVSGTEKVKITNKRTLEEVVVDVNSHGGFLPTDLPGEIGDTLSFRLFSKDEAGNDQQLGETLDVTVYSLLTPQVCKSSPGNGDKDIILDAAIIIDFTIPMDKTTITMLSFQVSSAQGGVSGSISFDDNLRASFAPDQSWAPATTYTIMLTNDITSFWGIPLGENYVSSFTTSDSLSFAPHIIAGGESMAEGACSAYAIDIDGDGDLDVLSGSGGQHEEQKIVWYENDGSQNFTAHTITTSVSELPCVFAIDLDGDFDVDVLSASYDGIVWFENNGNQSFTTHDINTNTGASWPSSIYAIDLDGDGDMDILSDYGDRIAWYENDGSQNFTNHTISEGSFVYAIDVDGDGDVDLLSANWNGDKIAWHVNDGDQNFTTHTITSISDPNAVFAIDVDKDGDVDVLSASGQSNDGKIAWFENDGNHNFTAHNISTDVQWPYSVCAIDVDGDSDIDILSASRSKIAWYENDGNQNFSANNITTNIANGESVYGIDLDGDGDIDILSASRDKVAWCENDGSQNFTTHNITASVNERTSVYVIDVDGDSDMDVLSASSGWGIDGKICWYENNGSQNFTTHIIETYNGPQYSSVYAIDVDGDSDMDLLSASGWGAPGKIAWYENDGNQNFTDHIISKTMDGTNYVYAIDVDGDGDMDVLSASGDWDYDGKICLYQNDGSQNFTTHIISTSTAEANSVYATDLDGDGDIDVLN